MTKLFISYRRNDTQEFAFNLYDELTQVKQFEVFLDRHDIRTGENFVERIERGLAEADVLLVLMGSRWLSELDARRNTQEDFVVKEVSTCLDDPSKKVFPVLIGNTTMPPASDLPDNIKDLALRNAFYVPEKNKPNSITVKRLIREIKYATRPFYTKPVFIIPALALLATGVVAGLIAYYFLNPNLLQASMHLCEFNAISSEDTENTVILTPESLLIDGQVLGGGDGIITFDVGPQDWRRELHSVDLRTLETWVMYPSARRNGPYTGEWSPDGTVFAFGGRPGDNPYPEPFQNAMTINITNAEGSISLAPPPPSGYYHQIGAPSWSPDGTMLAVHAFHNGRFNIYIMGYEQAQWEQLTTSRYNIHPNWSPAGNKIVYVSKDKCRNLWVHDLQTGENRQITDENAAQRAPDFSPDGQHIIYQSNGDGDWEIYTVSADGSRPQQLTRNTGIDIAPVYSPDGNYIAFISDREGDPAIYVMDLQDEGALWRVATGVNAASHLDWR